MSVMILSPLHFASIQKTVENLASNPQLGSKYVWPVKQAADKFGKSVGEISRKMTQSLQILNVTTYEKSCDVAVDEIEPFTDVTGLILKPVELFRAIESALYNTERKYLDMENAQNSECLEFWEILKDFLAVSIVSDIPAYNRAAWSI
jgi:hypothetical protein